MSALHDWLVSMSLTEVMSNWSFLLFCFIVVFVLSGITFLPSILASITGTRKWGNTLVFGLVIIMNAAMIVWLLVNWNQETVVWGKGGGAPVNHWVPLVVNVILLVSLSVIFFQRGKE